MTKKQRPPLSLTRVWDKAKWHDEESGHIRQALRFLAEHGQLTAEGLRTLQEPDDAELWIVREEVRSGARAFLDQYYDSYLLACGVELHAGLASLTSAWQRYCETHDPSRRPLATPFQQILIDNDVEQLHSLLLSARHRPQIISRLKQGLASVPDADRELVEAAVAAFEGRWDALLTFPAIVAVRAARYTRPSPERLRSVSKALENIDCSVYEPTREIAHAMTFPGPPSIDPETANAACQLDEHERDVLVNAARTLMDRAGDDEDQLIEAMAALATVGRKADAALLEPLHQSPSFALRFAARDTQRKLEQRGD